MIDLISKVQDCHAIRMKRPSSKVNKSNLQRQQVSVILNMNWYSKALILGLILLIFNPVARTQNKYTFQAKKDIPLFSVGLASGAGGWFLGKKLNPLPPEQLALLNRENIWPIDRKATSLFSQKADQASNFCFYGALLAPVLLVADRGIRKESGEVAVLYLQTLSLTGGLTELTKNLVKRPRPYNYNSAAPLGLKQQKDARKSFFSGHTSATATSCFFAAKVWSDFHPESRWKPAVWALAAGIPAFTGYLRIRAGRHFFTDVAVGYVVGATLGYVVPNLHANRKG
jgi:membrane-associated phospholipid phosphatase